jgi:hypothetical protein
MTAPHRRPGAGRPVVRAGRHTGPIRAHAGWAMPQGGHRAGDAGAGTPHLPRTPSRSMSRRRWTRCVRAAAELDRAGSRSGRSPARPRERRADAGREACRRSREAEERLRGLMTLAEDSAEGDLAQLTSVYENMKPKEAALLFERMSPDFAAGFLGRMRPEAAAAIMSGLPPELGYSISVLLAGRNAARPRSRPASKSRLSMPPPASETPSRKPRCHDRDRRHRRGLRHGLRRLSRLRAARWASSSRRFRSR